MSGAHPTREEDFDLYALGALDGDEKVAFETHLFSCAACKASLAGAKGRISLLALAAPATLPSPGVKDRLMRQLASTAESSGNIATRIVPQNAEGMFARWRELLLPAAGAFAMATLLLWLHNGQLERRITELRSTAKQQEAQITQARAVSELIGARDTVVVSLAEQKNQPEGTARVLFNSRRGLLVYNGHLPPTAPDKSYQLWLVPTNGPPISIGVFNSARDSANSVIAKVPVGISAKAFAVTLETAGGMPQPTGPMVLVGPVS